MNYNSDKGKNDDHDMHLADKRQRIINGAITVFACKGFYKAKIEEIAAQAGVGKGTVYEYFSSKKELFQEMFLYIEEKYEEMFQQELSLVDTFYAKLQKMFEVTIRFLERHKEMARILLAGYPPVSEDIQRVLLEKNQLKLEEISKILEEAIGRQKIRPVDTFAAAQVILGALFFVGGQILFAGTENKKKFDYDEQAQEVIDILLKGFLYP